jgi:peptidoglycan/LPS O-acetylase OafA/YrhL
VAVVGGPAQARVGALDGLRGCAILLVIAAHTGTPQSQTLGAAGVSLFFVLSGYLITSILLRTEADRLGSGLKAFYGRRSRRLLPALALLLLFDSTVRLVNGQSLAPVVVAATYGTNIATSLGYSSTLTHTWSLALEEQFYLVWPLLLPWLVRMRRAPVCVLVLAALSAGARVVAYLSGPWTIAYFSPATRCDAILVGCALAIAMRRGWRLPHRRAALFGAGVVFGACFLWSSLTAAIVLIPLVALASAALIAVLTEPGVSAPHRALAIAPLRYTGRVSYGMYLWHPFLAPVVVTIGLPLPFVTTTVLAVAVATVSWLLVERPLLRGVPPAPESPAVTRAPAVSWAPPRQRPVRSARSATCDETAGSSPSPSAR